MDILFYEAWDCPHKFKFFDTLQKLLVSKSLRNGVLQYPRHCRNVSQQCLRHRKDIFQVLANLVARVTHPEVKHLPKSHWRVPLSLSIVMHSWLAINHWMSSKVDAYLLPLKDYCKHSFQNEAE